MSDSAHFCADWLALREPIDHAARNRALEQRLVAALPNRSPLSVIDLGSGSGSNLRHLAARLQHRSQVWTLLDHDQALLERADQTTNDRIKSDRLDLVVKTQRVDLSRMDSFSTSGPDLVTASALLDLVSLDWIDHFAAQLIDWQAPVLMALSVDGQREFINRSCTKYVSADDEHMRKLFNQHQRQAKGLGRSNALGPDAVPALAERLTQHPFDVDTANSPWILSAGSHEARTLGVELLADWANAARAMASSPNADATSSEITYWQQRRLEQLTQGELGLRIGHLDLLALPR